MKKIMMLIAVTLLSVPVLRAHEGHVHEAALEAAPHGGSLRDAGRFKAEAVVNGNVVRIYVYDKTLKPVMPANAMIEGKIQFPKRKPKPVQFKNSGEFYEGTIPGIDKVHRYDLHVNLNIGGDVIADFGIDNIQ